MSRAAGAPALLSPEHAGKLLDEVVYERVLACIDLDALFGFEQELWHALDECGVDDDEVAAVAKQMIERGLARVGNDPRRYADFGKAGEARVDDCAPCALDAASAKRRATG